MPNLTPIVEKLREAQTTFFRVADTIPSEQWAKKPTAEEWSAAEVVAHLVMVERNVVGGADRMTQKTPAAVPLLKRMHLPLWLVQARLVRKSPLPLDPTLLGAKEEMLGQWRGAREQTLTFLERTKERDLSAYHWRHPFIGMLNVYEWFEMIAAHQLRHAKQMREVGERLPKPVTSATNW